MLFMIGTFFLNTAALTSIGYATTSIVNQQVSGFIKGFNSNKFSSITGLRFKHPHYLDPVQAALSCCVFVLIDFIAQEILKRALSAETSHLQRVVVVRVICATILTGTILPLVGREVALTEVSSVIFTSLSIYYLMIKMLPILNY